MGVQNYIKETACRFRHDDSGATSIEYALIGGLLSIAIITAVTAIGGTLSTTFSTVDSGFN